MRKSRGVLLLVAAFETTVTVKVPYCAACARHAKAFQGAAWATMQMPVVVLGALSFLFGLMFGDLNGLEGGSLTAAVLGAPLAVVGGFVAWRRSQRSAAVAGMQGRHACCGPAVTLDRFDEATLTLACVDDEFGRILAEANRPPRVVPA